MDRVVTGMPIEEGGIIATCGPVLKEGRIASQVNSEILAAGLMYDLV